ncbi:MULTISPECIES: asparagine synthase (glutamine-hydrolyzing) [unclassified Pedobacter]|uniref:asparagine synthase (glutamine-hydrolyzing) n=1 Tax=unclassified Pedobacter TaxID=2628915 RepID=UPI0014225027|nr:MULTISPECIES: asparagine synthase (glutamine-hydrolyzing) [unclassified Pedobacter]NII81340.1 asparagine synthase (glutamine-hydrolysing) [Pedobacter sp. SG908]NMN35346.1 asparagine synthase (glutamine-hydrolysing) [Pedobacter sp. SG918]
MCRIAGIIDKNRSIEQIKQEVKGMCTIMAHGGPDDEGFYTNTNVGLVIGHRRLALIDLSPNGHQPMKYKADELIISFNGEIYNYPELKKELQNLGFLFNTESDTEVILVAYAAWGIASFARLKGMFAFYLFDAQLKCSYLVRDLSGIKPLYYCATALSLVFSSEVKAFAETSYHYTEQPDWKIYFLAFGHIPEPYTTFNEILMLPKGHYMEWQHQSDTFEIKNYVQHRHVEEILGKEAAKLALEQNLRASVKRHLLSDAKIGVFLSGGIDSSILTLLADEITNQDLSTLNTISINFEETAYSEKAFQDIITEKINGKHSGYTITPSIFSTYFPAALKAMDQPTADGINSWFVNYFAKKNGLKAVLSGIGADELFGGYPSFKRMGLLKQLKKLPKLILKKSLAFNNSGLKRSYYLSYQNTAGEYLFLRGIFTPDEIAALLNFSIEKVDRVLKNINIASAPNHLDNGERASWLECNLYMQNQLLKDTDTMSMQHGIEVRVPFLDQDLLGIVKSIKPKLKFGADRPKSLLIDAFSAILPNAIWNREKMGFTFPFQLWLKKDEQFLTSIKTEGNQFASKMVNDFRRGNLHWSKVMALYQAFRV